MCVSRKVVTFNFLIKKILENKQTLLVLKRNSHREISYAC